MIRTSKMWRRRVGKIAYTVIQRTIVPGDFAHAVRRCDVRVGKRAATYALDRHRSGRVCPPYGATRRVKPQQACGLDPAVV
jgi:hypothetical protein